MLFTSDDGEMIKMKRYGKTPELLSSDHAYCHGVYFVTVHNL